jgi:hypothetical protein
MPADSDVPCSREQIGTKPVAGRGIKNDDDDDDDDDDHDGDNIEHTDVDGDHGISDASRTTMISREVLSINASGTILTVSAATLRQAPRGSYLYNLQSNQWGHDCDDEGNLFQGVQPECFRRIVSYLRLKSLQSSIRRRDQTQTAGGKNAHKRGSRQRDYGGDEKRVGQLENRDGPSAQRPSRSQSPCNSTSAALEEPKITITMEHKANLESLLNFYQLGEVPINILKYSFL